MEYTKEQLLPDPPVEVLWNGLPQEDCGEKLNWYFVENPDKSDLKSDINKYIMVLETETSFHYYRMYKFNDDYINNAERALIRALKYSRVTNHIGKGPVKLVEKSETVYE